MLDSNKISYYLQLFKELDLEDLFRLFSVAREKKLSIGEVYIPINANTRKLTYIKEGLIRAFHLKENGEEVTVLLRWEDQFFASYDTILFDKPSRFSYHAMEDTILLEADYDLFMEVLNKEPKFSKAKDFFLLNMLGDSMISLESFILLNPEERYLKLLQEKPNIIQRVPNKYLATLLGITPVSLSRIRKRISSSPKR